MTAPSPTAPSTSQPPPIPLPTLSWIVAWLVILLNGSALFGWVAHIALLVQPLHTFPPIRPSTAIGYIAIAIGLLAMRRGHARTIAAGGSIAFVIGGVSLAGILDGARTTLDTFLLTSIRTLYWGSGVPDHVAASSALFVCLGGFAVVVFAAPMTRRNVAFVIAAILGAIMVALAVTVETGHIGGFLQGLEYGDVLGSSAQSEITAVLVGMLFLALAWRQDTTLALPPSWLPLAVGTASLVTVLFLWKALIDRERLQTMEQVDIAMRAARKHLVEELGSIEGGMRRVARSTINTNMTPDAWRTNITALARDLDGVASIVWFDEDGGVVNAAPDTQSTENLALVVSAQRRPGPAAGDSARNTVRYVRLSDGTAAAVLPLCDGATCAGAIAATLDAPQLFAPVISDTSLGFHYAVHDGATLITSTAPLSTDAEVSVKASVFHLGPTEWRISSWPTGDTQRRTRTELPDLVLVLGLIVSALLPITLRLAQSAGRTAQAEERERINIAFERATDGIWEWDIPTGSATRSATLWRYLGYDPDSMAPRASTWTALIHPDDRARVQTAATEHLAGRTDAYEAQYRIQARDGLWHTIVDRGRVVQRGPTGAAIRVLGISADVTERRRAEDAIKEMDTLSTMGRLAARVAHEINNPLGGIQNSFLLVKDAIPESHPHFKYVGAIEREIARIAAITRQLYETYRPEREHRTDAPVHVIVGDAVTLLEQVNRNRQVRITVNLQHAPAVVPVPDSLLRQCVYNLVQNAVEASPNGSEVVVMGMTEGGSFVLSVQDQGPGIPAALRERIFEPFFSTKDSSVKTGGMGLGLALVRRSVQALGGSVTIGDAPGGGAEFIVRLPLTPIDIGKTLT